MDGRRSLVDCEEWTARECPTALVLEMVARLPTELRMTALGLRP
jgi:hypothetical protein